MHQNKSEVILRSYFDIKRKSFICALQNDDIDENLYSSIIEERVSYNEILSSSIRNELKTTIKDELDSMVIN